MGNEQSDNRRNQPPQPPQMPEAEVRRILEAQRRQYERKLEEVEARAAAQRKQDEAARAAAQRKQDEATRAAAQRKQQEDAAMAAAQKASHLPQTSTGISSFNIERDRTPYNYSGNQLQQTVASAPPAPQPLFGNVYPNLNQTPSSPNQGQYYNNMSNNNNNNPFQPRPQNQDFVFVNNFGQAESYNRPMPSPIRPPGPVSSPFRPSGPASSPFRPSGPASSPFRPSGPASSPFRPSAPAPRGASRGRGQRPRSVSRPRNTSRERDTLDCPTCNARYGMRIFSCDEGHSSCNDCKTRGRSCGLCGRSITNRRNYEMEAIIAKTKAPCPHSSEGCKLFIQIADMENHVKECPFKEQPCPLTAVFGTCHWKGKLSQLSNHFDNAHPNGRQINVDSEMKLRNVRNNSQEVHLVCLGVYNFLVHVKVSETDGKVYMAVQLIGTKFSAMKWVYEIHVYNKSENRRKYTYTDNCCSSNDKIDDVFEVGNCAVLPVWYANTFVCDGVLTYKFFIKKTNEESKVFVKNHRGRGNNHK